MLPPSTPRELLAVTEFCNSAVLLRGTDELASLPDARRWCRRNGLAAVASEAALEELRREREVIRAFIADRKDLHARHEVNVMAKRHLGAPRVDDEGYLTFEAAPGPPSPTADAVSALLLHGLWPAGKRLKACAADSCRYIFYDRSRSHTRTWCDMNVCGARHKMSDYRRRRDRA